jgi:hypothetical protein
MKHLVEHYIKRGLQPAQILANMCALGYDETLVQEILREMVLTEDKQLLQE